MPLVAKKERDSNMELLRIVAMSMVIAVHFFVHGMPRSMATTGIYYALLACTIPGVNLFFLISGWYGVHLTTRGVVRIVVTTFFFLVLSFVALNALGIETYVSWWRMIMFPVEGSGLWFIMVYLGLMLLSPILNAGLKNISQQKLLYAVILFTIFNVYNCWIGANYVNVNGYTLIQAIWLYCLGYCLRVKIDCFSRIRTSWLLSAYIIVTLSLIAMASIWQNAKVFYYNSPFVVVQAVSLFLFFTRINFRNSFVNRIAAASLGCYMLEDGIMGRNYLYPELISTYNRLFGTFGRPEAIFRIMMVYSVLFISIWMVSILLNPVVNKVVKSSVTIVERLSIGSKKRSIDSEVA